MMIRDLITILMDVFLLWQIESQPRRWALIYFSLQRIESFISQGSTAVKIRPLRLSNSNLSFHLLKSHSIFSFFFYYKTLRNRNKCKQEATKMMRNTILRSTATAMASTSFARPAIRARPVLAAVRTMGAGANVSKRGYHAKVIDHYENPRNVSTCLYIVGDCWVFFKMMLLAGWRGGNLIRNC